MARSPVIANLVRLIIFEVAALFVAWYTIKQLFQFDIFDFRSGMGQIVGIGITAVVMFSLYHAISSDQVTELGAAASYDPTDKRRYQAQMNMKSLLQASVMPATLVAK